MSEELDKRVVKLEFDNAKFEKNVKQTQKSLKDLDEQLAFKDGTDGIERVEASFSHFQIVAFTVISRITNKVIDLGVRLVKSLSVDNISAGWTKFGEKTTSVATMAAQKIKIAGKVIDDYGEKMEVINDQLEKLNWFTDETSYNFTDMVSNIGKFTAAGRSLDESVSAMMGIANWAALSGQNAATASRAMYQLSQALGKGYVQLMDWKSIITANMDTEEFREKALEAAVAIGELTKEGNKFITKTGKRFTLEEFTESLSSKWLTNDVLLKTLGEYSSAVERLYEITEEEGITATEAIEKYGDELEGFGLKAFKAAQEARTFSDVIASVKDAVSTGWMTTAEKIFGGYDESKVLWTELANQLYDVFAEGGNFRNEVLGLWRDLGGNKNIFGKHGDADQGAFWNIYDAITAVRNIIRDAWKDVFGLSSFTEATERAKDIAEKLNNLTKRIREFTKRVRDSLTDNMKLQLIFRGLFNVLKMGVVVVLGLLHALSPVFQTLKDIISYLTGKLAAVGLNISRIQGFVSRVEENARKLNAVIARLMESLNPRGILDKLFDIIRNIFNELKNYRVIDYIVDLIKDFSEAMVNGGGSAEDFQEILKGVGSILKIISKLIIDVAKVVRAYILPVLSAVTKAINYILGFVTGALVKILSFVGQFFTELDRLISTGNWQLSSISNNFKGFINNLGSNLEKIKPLLESVAKLTATLIDVIALLPTVLTKLSKAVTGRGIIENFKILFDKITEFFVAFRDSLDGNNYDSKDGIFAPITALAQGIATFLKGIVSILGPLITIAGNALNLLGILLQSIGDFLKGIISAFNGEDAKTVLDYLLRSALIIAGIAAVSLMIYNMFYTIVGIVKGWQYITTSIGDAVYAIGKSFQTKAVAEVIKGIAYVLISLSVAMLTIANIPEDGFIRAVSTIGGFVVLIGAVMAVMMLLNKKVNSASKTLLKLNKKNGLSFNLSSMQTMFYQLASFLTRLSVALLAFAVSLAIVAKLKPSEAWSGAGILASFMALTTVMIIALTKFGPKGGETDELNKETKSLKKAIKLIGVMSLMCFSISKAISKLGGMNTSAMWQGVAGFSTILGAFAIFVAVMNLTMKKTEKDVNDTRISQMAGMFASLALLALAMSGVIAILSSIDVGKAWMGIIEITALLGVMVGMVAVIDKLSGTGLVDYKDVSGFLFGVSFVLLSLSGTLAILSVIDPGKAWMGILEVTSLLAIMSGMLLALDHLSGFAGFNYKDKSAFFLGLSVVLLSMSGTIAIMNQLDSGKTWESIGQIAAILAAFTSVLAVLELASKNKVNGRTVVTMFTTISLVLLSMTGTLAIMNTMDSGKMWTSIGGVSALMAAFTIMIASLMHVRANTKRMKQSLAMMAMISAQLLIVSASLMMLKDVPWQNILAAAGAISTVLIAFAGAVAILSTAKVTAVSMISFSLGVLLLTASLLPMVLVLQMMENLSWMTIAKGAAMLAGTIILLVAATKILGPSTVLVLALGAAVALLGVGMLMAAMSLQVFAESLPAFLESIMANAELLGQVLETIGPVLVNALISAFEQMLVRLTDLVPVIVDLARALINGLLDILEGDGPRIIKVLIDLIDKLAFELGEHSDSIINSIGKIVMSGLAWLKDNIVEISTELFGILIKVIGVLTGKVPELMVSLRDFLMALITSLFNNIGPVLELLVQKTFNFLGDFIPKFIVELMKFTTVLVNSVLVLLANVLKVTIASLGTLAKLMLDFLTGIILLMVNVANGMGNVLFEAFKTILYNAFYMLSEVLIFLTTDINKLLGGALGRVLGALVEYLGDMINNYLGGLFGFGNTLKGWGQDIKNAASSTFDEAIMKGSNVTKALNEARTNISGTMHSITSSIKDDVEEGVGLINDSLQDSLKAMGMVTTSNVEDTAEKTVDAANKAMEEKIPYIAENSFKAGEHIGKDMSRGLQEGLDSENGNLQTHSTDAAKLVEEAMRKQTETHSPSRLFARLGRFLMQGLSLGIDEGAVEAQNSAVNSMNMTLMAVKDAVESDIDDEIVIRPVMDLTDVANGAQSISSIMSNVGNGRVSVSGELASSVQRKNSTLATESQNQNGTTVVNNNETYNPVFNITSNDPEEVAREVDIRMQRMHRQAALAKGGAG